MAALQTDRTTLSTKGQVVLPKSVRERKHWPAGTKFVIEDIPDGIALRVEQPKKRYTIDDLVGCMKYSGPPLSDAEIERRLDESFAQEQRDGKW